MFQFNEYECKIRMAALQKKQERQEIQDENTLTARNKEKAV